MRFLARMKAGLGKSRARLQQGMAQLFTGGRPLDKELAEELEDLLIMADLGPRTAEKLVASLKEKRWGTSVTDEDVRAHLIAGITGILEPVARDLPHPPASPDTASHTPLVIMVTGVNGSGKTTTIAKLAHYYREQGYRLLLAAGDTYRAAAVEQLTIWGERENCPVLTTTPGGDAAALSYRALAQAIKEKYDLVIIDTAGRLHTRKDLMDELGKIARVCDRQIKGAPHHCWMVIDATTGQNAHTQLEAFKEAVSVNGLIVTKLDGTAKGGILVSLAETSGLPVHAIGVGEGVDDLRPFDPAAFASTLLGLESDPAD